jgi:hypothetical protein
MNLSESDFANRELSIEELDAIAAGGFFGNIWHGIEHAASAVAHFVEKPAVYTTLITVAGAIFGSWANKKLN